MFPMPIQILNLYIYCFCLQLEVKATAAPEQDLDAAAFLAQFPCGEQKILKTNAKLLELLVKLQRK